MKIIIIILNIFYFINNFNFEKLNINKFKNKIISWENKYDINFKNSGISSLLKAIKEIEINELFDKNIYSKDVEFIIRTIFNNKFSDSGEDKLKLSIILKVFLSPIYFDILISDIKNHIFDKLKLKYKQELFNLDINELVKDSNSIDLNPKNSFNYISLFLHGGRISYLCNNNKKSENKNCIEKIFNNEEYKVLKSRKCSSHTYFYENNVLKEKRLQKIKELWFYFFKNLKNHKYLSFKFWGGIDSSFNNIPLKESIKKGKQSGHLFFIKHSSRLFMMGFEKSGPMKTNIWNTKHDFKSMEIENSNNSPSLTGTFKFKKIKDLCKSEYCKKIKFPNSVGGAVVIINEKKWINFKLCINKIIDLYYKDNIKLKIVLKNIFLEKNFIKSKFILNKLCFSG